MQFEGSNYEEEEGVLIDENHFPDVHFRNYVSRFDQNHDGKFSEEEISAIHSISLDSDSDDAAETKDCGNRCRIRYAGNHGFYAAK